MRALYKFTIIASNQFHNQKTAKKMNWRATGVFSDIDRQKRLSAQAASEKKVFIENPKSYLEIANKLIDNSEIKSAWN